MNQQDRSFLTTATGVLAALVCVAVVIFLISRLVGMFVVRPDDGARERAAIEARIKPVAQVAIADPNRKPEKLAPKDVVANVCASCHQAGVLGAPKIGSKDDWGPRFAQGIDTLNKHAIEGFKGMPAKGGNPTLSDDDVKGAIAYILGESGLEAGAAAASAQPAAAPAPAEPPPTPAAPAQPAAMPVVASAVALDLAKGKQVYGGVCVACHDSGLLNSPKRGDKAAWAPRAAQGFDTLVKHAINGLNAMPPRGGIAALGDADIRNAVAYLLSEAGLEAKAAAPAAPPAPAAASVQPAAAQPQAAAPAPAPAAAPVQPAAPLAEPAKAEPPAPVAAVAQASAAAPVASVELPAGLDLTKGKQLYDTACIICHQAGIANAPKFGDKAAWAPRLAQGWDTLVEHAIKGYKGMPAKGGSLQVSDDDMTAAIGYMVNSAQ